MEEEMKKYAYFTFRVQYAKGAEKVKEHVDFLNNFSEVTYPTIYLPYDCWKIEKNLIRKLKLKNLEGGLDENYKNFVRFMCNEELVRFHGYDEPKYQGEAGSTGTSGVNGSSGRDGIPTPRIENPFMEVFEEIN